MGCARKSQTITFSEGFLSVSLDQVIPKKRLARYLANLNLPVLGKKIERWKAIAPLYADFDDLYG